MFRDPVLKILRDILISWETIVVVLGFVAIFIFFTLSKKKYKQTSDSSSNTRIYTDLYSLNDMYKKGLINEEEYKKGKEFVSKTIKESLKKEKESAQVEKITLPETKIADSRVLSVPILNQDSTQVQTKQELSLSFPIKKEITIPPSIQKLIDDGLITKSEYIRRVESFLKKH
jgi:uncharacterized protein YqgQ